MGRHRLVTLGRLALAGRDGAEDPSLGKQRRKLALLAVLALARRPLARDYLVELFWGEQDEARARHSLSEALSHLRRVLGRDAITTRQAEVALAEAAAPVVDAHELTRAAAARDHARVVELYAGPFLDCVYLGSASFDAWVQGERTRLEALFLQACDARCTSLARSNRWDECAAVSARWLAAAPLSPHAAVFRLNALKMPGTAEADRRALDEYERLAALLQREYDLAPDPSVTELAGSIARRLTTAAPRSAPDAAGATGAPPLVPPSGPAVSPAPAGAAAEGALPAPVPPPIPALAPVARGGDLPGEAPDDRPVAARRWSPRRRGALVASGLAAVVALAAVAVLAVNRPAPVPTSGAAVAVLPFAVRGGPQYAYLREGMVDLLSTNLDGAGTLRSVDPRALLASVPATPAREISPAAGRAMARQLGAGLYVLGDVIGVEGRLRIDATLYDVQRGAVARASVDGAPGELFALVDRLTAQLLADRRRGAGDQLTRIAALTTPSLPALKLYLAGEGHYRAGRYAEALDAYERAVALDTTFALAHYRTSQAATWTGTWTWDSIVATSGRAVRHGGQLTRRARLLLTAFDAYNRGAYDEAERLYRAVVTAYPDDVEGWYQMGEVLFHGNPLRGQPATDARPPFERVLQLERDHRGALVHLLRIAATEGARPELDTLLARAIAFSDGDAGLELQTFRAFALGGRAAQEEALARLRGAADEVVRRSAERVAVHAQDLTGAERIATILLDPQRSSEVRATGHVYLAQLDLARGRRRAAAAQLAAAVRVDRAVALPHQALVTALPFVDVTPAELDAVHADVQRWNPSAPKSQYPPVAVLHAHYPTLRSYLLGILSVRRGDLAAAARHADALDAMPGGGSAEVRPFARGLAASVRAHAALAGGHDAEALAHFERARVSGSAGLLHTAFGSQSYERFARAELLRRLGRPDEALGWYESVVGLSADQLVYLAPAQLRQAEVYESLGRRGEAAARYRRLVQLWRECDPELRPSVDEAERRLAQLARAQQ